jgi:pyruvate-formate lyase-activating enzyme
VLDTDQAIRMLAIMRTRTPSVLMAGGEPTLRKDLPVITRAARNLSYYPIIVDTNGSTIHTLLEQAAWSSWLADVDHLVVSLDALNSTALTRMWGYSNPEDVVRNILLLRELADAMRIELMISTVIQPGAIHHARDVLDWSNDLGLCFCPMPVNIGPTIDRTLLDDEEYRDLVALILDRKRAGYRIAGSVRMNERMLSAQTLECRNTLKPHVDFNGNLFWPCKASVDIQPLEINVLDFDDVDAIYEFASKRICSTGFQQRCGARCNWSQNYTTDAYAFGLRHPWSIAREIVDFLKAV